MANNLFQGTQQPPKANVKVRLEDLTDIKCDECGGGILQTSGDGKKAITPGFTKRQRTINTSTDL